MITSRKMSKEKRSLGLITGEGYRTLLGKMTFRNHRCSTSAGLEAAVEDRAPSSGSGGDLVALG